MKKLTSFAALLAVVIVTVLTLTSAGAKQTRLFMVGDSTMADKTELEISPERGWGQLFPTFLSENVVVENHAMNGRSTRSFIEEGRWNRVVERLQKGDVVIIEFGHNDTKANDESRYAPIPVYEKNLIKMVEEARKKGATPILATPISRRNFSRETGEFVPKHGGYPDAVRRVAKFYKVPLLDLEASTAEWLRGLGDEASKKYFMNVAAGECTKFPEGKVDNTHLREAGALEVGRMAAKMIVDQKIKCLMKEIVLTNVEPKYTTLAEGVH